MYLSFHYIRAKRKLKISDFRVRSAAGQWKKMKTRKPRLALFYLLVSSAVQCSAFLALKQLPRKSLPKSPHTRRDKSSLAAWDSRGFEELKRRVGAACLSAAVIASPLSLALHNGAFVSIDRPSAQALTDEQVLVVSTWLGIVTS